MPDREKIIGHLNDCMEASRRDNTWVFVRKDIVEDALALIKEQEDLGTELTNAVELIHKKNERIEKLLKEQEAVEPYQRDAVWLCGNCEKEVVGWDDDIDGKEYRYPFCRKCGRSVKWG